MLPGPGGPPPEPGAPAPGRAVLMRIAFGDAARGGCRSGSASMEHSVGRARPSPPPSPEAPLPPDQLGARRRRGGSGAGDPQRGRQPHPGAHAPAPCGPVRAHDHRGPGRHHDDGCGAPRPGLDSRDDDSALAFSALVEGDAVRVEQAYQNTMSLSDRDQLGREESAQLGQLAPSIPEVLIELVGFPYTYGPRYVQSVLSSAGQVRLDQAFTSPPTTTEQILHPDRWLAGDPPAPLAQPKADAAVVDKGVLGELGFDLVLQKVVGVDETRAALADWGGDQYVAWDASGRTCLRDTVTAGGGGSAAAMQRALRDYTRRRSGATLTGAAPDPMTFTVCA